MFGIFITSTLTDFFHLCLLSNATQHQYRSNDLSTIEHEADIDDRLDKLLHDLITHKEYIDFLIGRDGEFDLLASAAVKRAVSRYGCGNTHLTLVLPYMRAEYRDNEKEYLDYYDDVEICPEAAEAHPKSAIQIRNHSMIDRSDLVICCIQHESGGAYKSMQYAKKLSKRIINLADEK